MKPFEKGDRGEDGNIVEGMRLLKVHCTHLWNYHNEIPLYH
jgi:hypothetical protein